MSREIEEFMDCEDAYNVLRHACYQFNECYETIEVLNKFLDNENKETTIPPVEVARELMQADIHHLMDDDIFYFIDKALRDAYYQLQDPMASYELGCLYYYERYNHVNYKKAFKYFSKEKHIGDSNVLVGECYFYGRGVEKSYKDAYFNLVKSALTDDSAHALYLLGDMYLNGYFVEQDIPEAKDLYWHALNVADQLNASSRIKAEIHYRIGMDYYHRPNTIDNLTVALKAFNTTELLLLEVMNEGNPSLIQRIQKLRQTQMEVKECIDEFILTPLEPLN